MKRLLSLELSSSAHQSRQSWDLHLCWMLSRLCTAMTAAQHALSSSIHWKLKSLLKTVLENLLFSGCSCHLALHSRSKLCFQRLSALAWRLLWILLLRLWSCRTSCALLQHHWSHLSRSLSMQHFPFELCLAVAHTLSWMHWAHHHSTRWCFLGSSSRQHSLSIHSKMICRSLTAFLSTSQASAVVAFLWRALPLVFSLYWFVFKLDLRCLRRS